MLKVQKLGRLAYDKALKYQNELVEAKQKGLKTDYFLLLEHDHVFTIGKGGDKSNILEENIPVIVTNRGGDVTYHGPGQLIGYIILDLKSSGFDIHTYLRFVESLIIDVIGILDIEAYSVDGATGIWSYGKKVASIGVGVKGGITMHGFALNVNTDLSMFSKIRPCGFNPEIMTSVQNLIGEDISMSALENLFADRSSYFLNNSNQLTHNIF